MLVSHSPEQPSSPRMPLSPLASQGKRGTDNFLSGNSLAATNEAGILPGGPLGYYGLSETIQPKNLIRDAPMAAFLAEGVVRGGTDMTPMGMVPSKADG